MSLYPEMDNASFAQLVAWWQQSDLPNWMAEEGSSIEDARSSLLSETAFAVAESDDGRTFLRNYLYAEDITQRRQSLAALAHKNYADATVIAALIAAFRTDMPSLQIEALIGFHTLEQFPLSRNELEIALHSDDGLTAAWALACQCDVYPNETPTILQEAFTDLRPHVREMACDIVGDNDIRALTEAVSALRKDSDEYVRQAAEMNYRMLTGADL